MSFSFKLFPTNTIVNNGTYRSWRDGSYAKSCKEYRNPVIQGRYMYTGAIGDGVYRIKPDSNPAFNVYCDMTTDGGGWTNINYNFGSVANPIILAGAASYSNNTSDTIANFPTFATTVNNTCNGSSTTYGSYTISDTVKTLLNASELKVQAKSYNVSGDVRCGGLLAYATTAWADITKLDHVGDTLHDYYLAGICDNTYRAMTYGSGYGWSAWSTNITIHWKVPWKNTNEVFMAPRSVCASGTSYNQLVSIMVR